MRYGVIVVSPIEKQGRENFVNLGDMVQTIAMLNIYSRMGIAESEIIRIELTKIHEYDGEYVILPININLSLNWLVDIFPLPPHIIPVFLGLSYFAATSLPEELVTYFKTYEPIGCRDESTLNLMRNNGILAYLFGCITATLPQINQENVSKDKIFLVDVAKEVVQHLPTELIQKYKVETISHIYSDSDVFDVDHIHDVVQKLLISYAEDAKLIITSRLHCLSPCIAMGIPVIPVVKNCSPRMGWIDRLVRIYSLDEMDEIDWNPEKIEYEETKELMIRVAIKEIQRTYNRYSDVTQVSYFFEKRKRSIYGNYYYRRLNDIKDYHETDFKYAIWGAGQIGMNVNRVIHEQYPNSELVAVIDSFVEGQFENIVIQKPAVIESLEGVYFFVATFSGEKEVVSLLKSYGLREYNDYISMASENG